MKHERRNTRDRRRGHYPLALGLIASALLHLLLVLLDPRLEPPEYGDRAARTPAAHGTQFTVLSLSPRDEDDLIRPEAMPPTMPLRTQPFSRPGAAPLDARAHSPEAGREATVAERLRYHTRPFSPPIAPWRETDSERAIRETRERVARAGDELGPLPPNRVSRARRGGGIGISIPFGFKPPGPAQTVPAPPLPDSILRRDSIRTAVRAAARSDSIRAARSDTTKLRNVAPRKRVVIPRVAPDTTTRKP